MNTLDYSKYSNINSLLLPSDKKFGSFVRRLCSRLKNVTIDVESSVDTKDKSITYRFKFRQDKGMFS